MDTQQQLFGLMALAEEHQKAVKAAIDGLAAERVALAQAVTASVGQSLAGASEAAAKAIGEAAKPVLGRLSGVMQAASEAEGAMRNAGAWFAWKWVAVAAGGLVGVCLVAYASLAWQLHQVNSLAQEKAELASDVARLQANVSALEKKGGRIVMNTCGGRLCFEASSNQGQNAEQWKGGVWSTKEGAQLVIPRGY